MSKRPLLHRSPTENATKKPRLELQEQMERASLLAAQLQEHAGKTHLDTKSFTANRIATDELVRIFQSMQEKTTFTSNSIDGLITAQIHSEVKTIMNFLVNKGHKFCPLGVEIAEYIDPVDAESKKQIVSAVQRKLEGVVSADYVAKIKELIKEVLMEQMLKGVGEKFDGILSLHLG